MLRWKGKSTMIYRFRIKGHIDTLWADRFEGMTIVPEDNGDTLLTGPVADQAALHGLLKKVRNLGMPLVSVNPFEPLLFRERSVSMVSNKRTARVAGFLYLGVILTGMFAELAVRSRLIVAGNAAATAGNIVASGGLFRLGILGDLVMGLLFITLAVVLYKLLKPVNKVISLLFVFLVAISTAMTSINLLNQFAAAAILGGHNGLTAFSTDQLRALAMFFLDMHAYGYLFSAMFYGTWLFPLGYLVFTSGFFPKVLGVFLMIAPLGSLMEIITKLFFPGFEALMYPGFAIGMIAEFSFCFWLLFKGAKDQKSPS
jgi:hypothetical protein